MLDAKLLTDKSLTKYFCNKNAAACRDWLEKKESSEASAFEEMFSDWNGSSKCPQRSGLWYIKSYLPTDVQAEILVGGKINSSYINKIVFESEEDYDYCCKIFKNKDLLDKRNTYYICRELFESRNKLYWEVR